MFSHGKQQLAWGGLEEPLSWREKLGRRAADITAGSSGFLLLESLSIIPKSAFMGMSEIIN